MTAPQRGFSSVEKMIACVREVLSGTVRVSRKDRLPLRPSLSVCLFLSVSLFLCLSSSLRVTKNSSAVCRSPRDPEREPYSRVWSCQRSRGECVCVCVCLMERKSQKSRKKKMDRVSVFLMNTTISSRLTAVWKCTALHWNAAYWIIYYIPFKEIVYPKVKNKIGFFFKPV